MSKKKYSLAQLADFLSAELRGDRNCVISSIAPLNKAVTGQISFFEDSRYKDYLSSTKASAVILTAKDSVNLDSTINLLIVENPYLCYAKISKLFVDVPILPAGTHETTIIGKCCIIDGSAAIGPYCTIGESVRIGKNVQIHGGCRLGKNSIISSDTILYPNVTLYHNVRIGERCIIHSGAVIGSDGFGNVNHNGVWHKIYQLGSVVIGNDVEIGANTTLDRGALEDTIIEDGVKLDNQIQVAHNVQIGAHTAIAGCVGIAGSTKIGKHCMIGGGVGVSGHIDLCDGTILTARSAVHKSIDKPGIYAGAIPAMEHRAWWRILKRLLQLDDLFHRVNKLEKEKNG